MSFFSLSLLVSSSLNGSLSGLPFYPKGFTQENGIADLSAATRGKFCAFSLDNKLAKQDKALVKELRKEEALTQARAVIGLIAEHFAQVRAGEAKRSGRQDTFKKVMGRVFRDIQERGFQSEAFDAVSESEPTGSLCIPYVSDVSLFGELSILQHEILNAEQEQQRRQDSVTITIEEGGEADLPAEQSVEKKEKLPKKKKKNRYKKLDMESRKTK